MKGQSFEQYLDLNSNKPFYKTLNFFIKISSLDKAIQASYEYENSRKELIKQLIKDISYPIFTLCFALLVFIFFNIFLYPQLSILIKNTSNISLNRIVNLLINTFILLIFIFIILLIIYLFIRNKPIFESIYKDYLGKIFIFKDIFTYDFAFHYYLLIKQGYTTKQVFNLLLNLKKNSIFSLNIKIFIDKLNNGISFNEIIENHNYFDSKFITFFKIGYYTQSLDQVLIDYLSYQKNNLNKNIKRVTVYITAVSYLMISLLIVSIYQMLLIPIDMIQNF